MFIFRIEENNRHVGYVKDFQTALESLRISWSAYKTTLETKISSIVVHREGFDSIEYQIVPVEVFTQPTHL